MGSRLKDNEEESKNRRYKELCGKSETPKLVRRRLIEPPPTFCPNKINFQRRKRI